MNRSTGMSAAFLALALLAGGCELEVGRSLVPPTTRTEQSAVATPSSAASSGARPSLQPGFPVLPGAWPAPLEEQDPDLIAAWTSDQLGSAAYDFYVDALPAAGYSIDGLFPGGDFAIIRFRIADGVIWQIVIDGQIDDAVRIEVRLDRP